MGDYNDVNVTGKSSLSPEEVNRRREEFAKLRDEGHTIELTQRGNNSGVSYDYMDRLNKDIEAGIFYDKKDDGFTNEDKRGLGKEFTSVFLEHGYIKSEKDFRRMTAGKTYEITYDEYVKLANSAGYYLVEEPPKPVVKEETPKPVVDSVTKKEPEPVAKAEPVVEEKPAEPEGENLSVELEAVTYTDEQGNVIADETKGTVNGEPYYSKFGFGEFGTREREKVDPETLYSNEDDDEDVTTPAAKKTSSEPDDLPPQVKNDTPTGQVAPVEVPVVKTTSLTKTGDPRSIAEEMEAIPEFAGKTGKERLAAIETKMQGVREQISKERAPKYDEGKKVLGITIRKPKQRALTEDETQKRDANIARYNEELAVLDKYRFYTTEIEGENWMGRYSPESKYSEDGTEVEKYPSFDRTTVYDEEGNSQRVARVVEYSTQGPYGTPVQTTKYYPVKVEKIGDPHFHRQSYWSVVPDMSNELVGYKEK